MPTFNLRIREHEESGENGIYINMGRDYFQPCLSGITVAHDILEHPVKPHPDGYVEELMAFGGIIAGRVEQGWGDKFGRRLSIQDLTHDLIPLVEYSVLETGEFSVGECRDRLRDSETTEQIRAMVRRSFEQCEERVEGASIDNTVGWICKGYKLYRKRFAHNIYDTSTHLFNQIAKLCQDWLDNSEEWDKAKLHINFRGQSAWLDREYE